MRDSAVMSITAIEAAHVRSNALMQKQPSVMQKNEISRRSNPTRLQQFRLFDFPQRSSRYHLKVGAEKLRVIKIIHLAPIEVPDLNLMDFFI